MWGTKLATNTILYLKDSVSLSSLRTLECKRWVGKWSCDGIALLFLSPPLQGCRSKREFQLPLREVPGSLPPRSEEKLQYSPLRASACTACVEQRMAGWLWTLLAPDVPGIVPPEQLKFLCVSLGLAPFNELPTLPCLEGRIATFRAIRQSRWDCQGASCVVEVTVLKGMEL